MSRTGKPLSWKWRLAIAFIILFGVTLIFVFTPWGFRTMKGWLDKAYEECPVEERATHWSADWYLRLAWWEAVICGRRIEGENMYRDFLGILPKNNVSFREAYLRSNGTVWNGKVEVDTKKKLRGWGILHPRAPEAYLTLLQLDQPYTSAQETSFDATFYTVLFRDLYGSFSGQNKPHPKFYVYWPKIENMIKPQHVIPGYRRPDPRPTAYEGPEK